MLAKAPPPRRLLRPEPSPKWQSSIAAGMMGIAKGVIYIVDFG
jgi:hypothetical protein